MARSKEKQAGSKAKQKPAQVRNSAAREPAVRATVTARDPRLPPVGTVLEKRDRAGRVRCTCLVEEGGFKCGGKMYTSLSAAALAACRALGLAGSTQNGWAFWGLTKAKRKDADPSATIARVWGRYFERASEAARDGGTAPELRTRIREHATKLADLARGL